MSALSARDVTNQLKKAIRTIGGAVEACETIDEESKLPDAFKVVAKHLPLVQSTLKDIKAYLDGNPDDQPDAYADIKEMADACPKLAERLEDLFNSVDGDEASFLERYSKAVGQDDRLELVMKDLLGHLRDAAREPFVTAENVQAIKDALKEVKAVKESLPTGAGGGHMFNNYSSGIQPVHVGKGHIMLNSGSGQMFSGDKPSIYYGIQHPPPN